ncbi:hypothetical protein MWU75_07200 [Ornithinimicrobium sp. F0845]|uniref:hypothetical protein n=1 Tax=Ornithinimicrobium sp. F0845 TaxID=2926412 RepID=UPI001FF24428|nr:hypothetical protein [Ornithinimicrobium sp. F0845]MCK0111921.1 hypothetical protein [Ornithinimicrobium sp. F0845]
MEVGDPDGYGQYGMLMETAEGLVCHECGQTFTHLGLHTYKAHGLAAAAYKKAHGLGRVGLVAADTRQVIVENARRRYAGTPAFIAARDPRAAHEAFLAKKEPHSPAGRAAIRRATSARRGSARKGTVVVCNECGVSFCPLMAATKRRFCTRSCASKWNRRAR